MVAGAAHSPKPCEHDNWDNVRIKKGTATLRCRECQAQWKVCHTSLPRCQTFLADGVCKDENCTAIHVNQFKQNLKTRRELHGDTVLENIPTTFWNRNKKKAKAKVSSNVALNLLLPQLPPSKRDYVLPILPPVPQCADTDSETDEKHSVPVDALQYESDSRDEQVSSAGSACHSDDSASLSCMKRVVYVEDDGSTYVEEFPIDGLMLASHAVPTPHARLE